MVTIVVPTVDVDKFIHFEQKFGTPECPVLIKNFLEFPGKGFVNHLAMKCYADVFQPDMDLTLHLDPDCLWIKPTSPEDYLVDGKPVLIIEPFDAILKVSHEGRFGWKKVTEDALKCPVSHETMCRHPAIHYRDVYQTLRKHMEFAHLTPFTDYVIKQKNSFPQGFAEFPALGAIAMKYFAQHYHFIDRGFDGNKNDPEPHIEQMWSYHFQTYIDRIKQILA